MVFLPVDQSKVEIKDGSCSKNVIQKGSSALITDPIEKLVERIEKLVQQVEKNNKLLYSLNLLEEFKARKKVGRKQVGKQRKQPQFKWMTF